MKELRKRTTFHRDGKDKQYKGIPESKLEAVIRDLREQQYADLESAREDMEEHYEEKVTDSIPRRLRSQDLSK